MPWTFFGVELASRALQAMQMAMNTTAHNLTNVNTPGYSRQRVVLSTTDPHLLEGVKMLVMGTGVRVDHIQRIRDLFLDARVAETSSQHHRLNTLYERLTQVEDTFSEPTEAGLSRQIVAFFNAFHELSANPENVGVRASVYQRTEGMTRTFRQLATRLDEMYDEMRQRVESTINEINAIAHSIADLNAKIRHYRASGTSASDLLDKRSQLVERLSEYVQVRITHMADGTIRLSLGEFVLVEGERVTPLPTGIDLGGKRLTNGVDQHASILGGSMRGLMDAMESIAIYRQRLDRLAAQIVAQINAIHRTGYALDGNTGYNLLSGTNALTIALSEDITDINRIAAGNRPAPGDGSKALEIARLRWTSLAELDNKTIPDFYTALVAELGEQARTASIGQENQKIILENLQAQREAVSGVNVDEEMSNLLRYQRAYQAAAQLVAVMDAAVADLIAAFVGRR